MRKLKWPVALLFLFISCKKDSSGGSTTPTKTIVGQWTWYKSVSVIATVTPQSSGHFWGLKFNSDSSCVQSGDLYAGGTGTYSLGYIVAPMASGTSLKITIPLYTQTYIYNLKSTDSLQIYDPAAPPSVDGNTHYFIKR
ncbi:MAG: hypothetical protein ABUL41_03290 [Chitinophagaceae bacterium]